MYEFSDHYQFPLRYFVYKSDKSYSKISIMNADVLKVIRGEFSKLKIPQAHDKCYKDECMVSFDSPFSPEGLFVNMSTMQGFGHDYYLADAARTNNKLYLSEKWHQIPKETAAAKAGGGGNGEAPVTEEPTKLAIGIPGGFITEAQFDLVKEHSLVVITPEGPISLPFPNQGIPEFVSNVVQGVIDHDGMKSKMSLDTWSADKDIFESKYARGLVQLETGKKIPQDPKVNKVSHNRTHTHTQ